MVVESYKDMVKSLCDDIRCSEQAHLFFLRFSPKCQPLDRSPKHHQNYNKSSRMQVTRPLTISKKQVSWKSFKVSLPYTCPLRHSLLYVTLCHILVLHAHVLYQPDLQLSSSEVTIMLSLVQGGKLMIFSSVYAQQHWHPMTNRTNPCISISTRSTRSR